MQFGSRAADLGPAAAITARAGQRTYVITIIIIIIMVIITVIIIIMTVILCAYIHI